MWVSFPSGVFGRRLGANESNRNRNSEQRLDGGEPDGRSSQESVSERQLISWVLGVRYTRFLGLWWKGLIDHNIALNYHMGRRNEWAVGAESHSI